MGRKSLSTDPIHQGRHQPAPPSGGKGIPPHPPGARDRRLKAALLAVFGLALAIRLVDLTDPPLDFQAWRQLRSASIARAMYFEMATDAPPQLREKAIELGRFEPLEPPVFERVVSLGYRAVGREELWIARLLAILFWLAGGGALFLLARADASGRGALLGLIYYFFLPFGVVVSRSFLPDVPMTAMAVSSAFLMYRWVGDPKWSGALLAGLVSGFAILLKVFAAFPLFLLTAFLVLREWGLRKTVFRPQVWVVAIVAGSVPALYYFFFLGAGAAPEYLAGWVVPYTRLLLQPWFYLRWAAALQRTVSLAAVVVAALGFVLARGRVRWLLAGLWIGYVFIGASVPSLIISHDYYQTLLIPLVALSLVPAADWAWARIPPRQPWAFLTVAAVSAAVVLLGAASVDKLLERDYRAEVLGWIKMGRELPEEGRFIGLSHDYNARVRYYGWTRVDQWPHLTDREMSALRGGNYDPNDPSVWEDFRRRTEGYDYFLVTLFGEFERQPLLKAILFDRFPVTDGDGYLLFHLQDADG